MGKGLHPAAFWAPCERCEQLYQDRQDEAIVALMAAVNGTDDVNEDARKPLAVFRDADLGVRRFAESTHGEEFE